MNEVERLQGEVAALSRRMARCETLLAFKQQDHGWSAAAAAVAEEIGVGAAVMNDGAAIEGRRKLAMALAKRRWSCARIARVMGVCERTAQRWTENIPSP